MVKILPLWLLLIGFILIGDCYDLPGGDNVVVIGHGSEGSATSPPVYSSSNRPITTRDPGNYVVPEITIPDSTSTDSTSTSSSSNLSSSGANTLVFNMTSDVEGTGSFAVRSKLQGNEKDLAYQSISARYGNLTQSRKMRFAEYAENTTDYDYGLATIDTQDSINFLGKSYSDISRFQNNEDLIQEIIRAGAISKGSRFNSQYLQVSLHDDINATKTLYNNYTVYNINTRFVGSSDLHATTNGTEIMQSYIGQIALNRKITSHFMGNDTFRDDYWLPCCNLANDRVSQFGRDI